MMLWKKIELHVISINSILFVVRQSFEKKNFISMMIELFYANFSSGAKMCKM